MNSKAHILSQIRQNRPPFQPLPELPDAGTFEGVEERFKDTLTAIGGEFIAEEPAEGRLQWLVDRFGPDARVLVLDAYFGKGNFVLAPGHALYEINKIDVAVVPGRFGVAENGAVWVEDCDLPMRILPFIAQHLILTLQRGNLLPDMHAAYRRIGKPDSGFGVFIAGPSKTADIEQALVKGAQGPRTATVWLKPE